jgi:hypothetical protein
MILKIFRKLHEFDLFLIGINRPIAEKKRRNSTQWQRRKAGQWTYILMKLQEQYFELLSVFKEASRNFLFIFLKAN